MHNTIALVSMESVVDHSERELRGKQEASALAAKLNPVPEPGSLEYAALFYTREAFWNPDFVILDKPLPGAEIALARLEQLHETVGILTRRPDFLREATEAWLDTHRLWADHREIRYGLSKTEEWVNNLMLAAALHDQVLFVGMNTEIRTALHALGLVNVVVKDGLDDYIDDGSPIIV